MLFESANFIKDYSNTDKFLQLLYPNGKRYITINAIQNKKVVLNKKKVLIYQEGQQPYSLEFLTDSDAKTGFDLLNAALDILKANGNSNGGNGNNYGTSIIRLPKHSSVTSNDIGKIIMNKVNILNSPPMSVDDVECLAYVCTTEPMTAGEKGVWELNFSPDFPLEPLNKIIRVTFIGDMMPINFHRWDFGITGNLGTLTFFFLPSSLQESEGQLYIGSSISDTISAIQHYFSTQSTTLTQNVTLLASGLDVNNHYYLDFRFTMNGNESQYTLNNTIDFTPALYQNNSPSGFESTLSNNFTSFDINTQPYGYVYDNWGNQVIVSTETSYNIDGYAKVISFQSESLGLFNTTGGISSGTYMFFKDGYLYLGVEGNYNILTSSLRLDTGQWVMNTASAYSTTIALVFPVYKTIDQYFAATTIQGLTTDRVSLASSLSNETVSYTNAIFAQTWDGDNSSFSILNYHDLCSYANANPYGLVGAYNIKYFSSRSEYIQAINWAMQSGPNSNFNNLFNIISPLAYDINSGRLKMTVENKTPPVANNSYSSFSTGGFNSTFPDAVTTTITSPVQMKPERIANAIVGVLVGVEGDDALVDSAFINKVRMCSSADGAMGTLPYTELLQAFPFVMVWRDGKVIDFPGWSTEMYNAGFSNENVHSYWLLNSGILVPITLAQPDEELYVKQSTFPFPFFEN